MLAFIIHRAIYEAAYCIFAAGFHLKREIVILYEQWMK